MKLLVLGGGPAGINGALHAREFGADVTLLEAKQVGGTSLNDGVGRVGDEGLVFEAGDRDGVARREGVTAGENGDERFGAHRLDRQVSVLDRGAQEPDVEVALGQPMHLLGGEQFPAELERDAREVCAQRLGERRQQRVGHRPGETDAQATELAASTSRSVTVA
jgi:hypothetical protein